MHFSWCFDFSLRFFHLFIKEDSHYSHLVADPQYTYLVKSTKMCEKKGNPRTMSRPTLAFVVKKGRNDYLKGGDLRVLIKSRRNFMDGIAAVQTNSQIFLLFLGSYHLQPITRIVTRTCFRYVVQMILLCKDTNRKIGTTFFIDYCV